MQYRKKTVWEPFRKRIIGRTLRDQKIGPPLQLLASYSQISYQGSKVLLSVRRTESIPREPTANIRILCVCDAP
jgi:hypothetical protein